MKHYYGAVKGLAKGYATRVGTKRSGLATYAATLFNGAIAVTLSTDDNGRDTYRIEEITWLGRGRNRIIAEGRLNDQQPRREEGA